MAAGKLRYSLLAPTPGHDLMDSSDLSRSIVVNSMSASSSRTSKKVVSFVGLTITNYLTSGSVFVVPIHDERMNGPGTMIKQCESQNEWLS